jgi:ferritin
MNEHLEAIVEEWALAKYQKANSINDVAEFIERLRLAECDEQANRFWQMFLDEQKTFEPKPEPQPRSHFEELAKIFKP